jgi:hypothetical protein
VRHPPPDPIGAEITVPKSGRRPRDANSRRQSERTRLITGARVIATINGISGLKQPVSAATQG